MTNVFLISATQILFVKTQWDHILAHVMTDILMMMDMEWSLIA